VEQHRIITLYQDRDALIQEAGLASPELTVILLFMLKKTIVLNKLVTMTLVSGVENSKN